MKKYPNFSRILAFLLVLAMVLPSISMTAFSQDIPCAEDGCSGKYLNGICSKDAAHYEAAPIEGGVYKISNAGQLYWFAALVNSGGSEYTGDNGDVYDAALTADITINADMEAEDSLAWTPIGLYTSATEYVRYSGTFDGKGYTIYGLVYDNTAYHGRNAGLFGTLDSNGTVKDLTLADSVINGATDIGGIVSHNYGTVIGCVQLGTVTGTGATGGIVCRNMEVGIVEACENRGAVTGATTGGIAAENNGTVVGCINSGAVSGTNSVGGIVGMNDGLVSDSLNTADVTGANTHVGGVVGNHIGGKILACGNSGDVSGASDYIGGVAGVCSGATVTKSYNTGAVTGGEKSDAVGGVVGAVDGTNTAESFVTICYNTGAVSGRSWVGGIAGLSGYQKTPQSVLIDNSYNTGSVTGSAHSGAVVGKLSKGTVSGTYFLQGCAQNTVAGATGATAEQFASGEIAAQLNKTTEAWYQALDIEGIEPDASPVLDRTHGTVYRGYCNCTELGYTNRENYDEPGSHVDADGDNVCDVCGLVEGEVHEHIFGDEWTVTKEPTCSEPGIQERKCTECGWTQKREIPTTAHTEEIIPGIPATFDETGLTDGKKCSVCGQILVAQETAPVRDYNEGIIPLEVLEVSCGDYETDGGASEGPADLAVDDDLTTIWHTDWQGTSRENHWIQFELTEEYNVDGLRYKPRTTGNTNGIITRYDIQVSNDGVNFESVASGTWAGDRNWKVVEFEPQNVKYVRLVALDAITDNSWVFACAAEIRLTGAKPGESLVENPFIDVPEDEWYFDPVLWAVGKGITTGTSATTFDPDGKCMRAVVVTFLWRAKGCPEPTSTQNPFSDVKESDYFYKAVLWALENEITNGISATEFGSEVYCNRAQVVTFLWRAMGKPASDADVAFEDVEDGKFYTEAVAWAVENEITNGLSATEFGVEGICNRAQVVTFLYRTLAE